MVVHVTDEEKCLTNIFNKTLRLYIVYICYNCFANLCVFYFKEGFNDVLVTWVQSLVV